MSAISLDLNGKGQGPVIVNGVDISRLVTEATITLRAGQLPQVEVVLVSDDLSAKLQSAGITCYVLPRGSSLR